MEKSYEAVRSSKMAQGGKAMEDNLTFFRRTCCSCAAVHLIDSCLWSNTHCARVL